MEYDARVQGPPASTDAERVRAPDDPPDEAVVASVLAGDVAQFEVLMRRHNRRLFRTARAILRSDDDAEDAMQDAYVAAYQHLREWQGRAKLSTWLVRITVHAALARIRKGKRITSLEDLDALDGGESALEEQRMKTRSPEDAASDGELRVALEQAVDELPPTFRTVFVMRAVEEMSVTETAEALEIPEETVRTRLHRARGMLREDLSRRLEPTAKHAFGFHLSRCDRVVAAVFRRIGAEKGNG